MQTSKSMEERQRECFGYTPVEVQQIFRQALGFLFEEFGFREVPLTYDSVLPDGYRGYGIEAENNTTRVTAITDGYDLIPMIYLDDIAGNPLITLSWLVGLRGSRLKLYESPDWGPGPRKISKMQIERHAAILYEIGRDLLVGDFSAVPELVAEKNRRLAKMPTHHPTFEQLEEQSEEAG